MRSEYAANLALQAKPQAWQQPSICRRPAKRSLFARLVNLFN